MEITKDSEAKNFTPLNIDKVKAWAKKNKDYKATHYLCLIPQKPAKGMFSDSYRQVTGRNYHSAYWSLFQPGQKGYAEAIEKYPIKNTTDGSYPKLLVSPL